MIDWHIILSIHSHPSVPKKKKRFRQEVRVTLGEFCTKNRRTIESCNFHLMIYPFAPFHRKHTHFTCQRFLETNILPKIMVFQSLSLRFSKKWVVWLLLLTSVIAKAGATSSDTSTSIAAMKKFLENNNNDVSNRNTNNSTDQGVDDHHVFGDEWTQFRHFMAHNKSMTCSADEHARPFNNQIRGVSLGGWMVLEPWITPSLFYQFLSGREHSTAFDTYTFCQVLGAKEANRQLRNHWDKWVTKDIITHLAQSGAVNSLRLPVGDYMYKPYGPYVGCFDGALEYVDNLLDWAYSRGLSVLIDVHTMKDSQNGFDNSGQARGIEWTSALRCVLFFVIFLTILSPITRKHFVTHYTHKQVLDRTTIILFHIYTASYFVLVSLLLLLQCGVCGPSLLSALAHS